MNTQDKNIVPVKNEQLDAVELALVLNDLSKLSSEQRLHFIKNLCDRSKISHLSQPFQYLFLNGKLTLYATKNCSDQLRAVHDISVIIVNRERIGDIYVVTARANLPNGRQDESTGAVWIGKASGNDLANAYMKAETKAKRRVTLSLMGIGFMDESELETVKNARRVNESEIDALLKEKQNESKPKEEESATNEVDSESKPNQSAEIVDEENEIFTEQPSDPLEYDKIMEIKAHMEGLGLTLDDMKIIVSGLFEKQSMRDLMIADYELYKSAIEEGKSITDLYDAKMHKK